MVKMSWVCPRPGAVRGGSNSNGHEVRERYSIGITIATLCMASIGICATVRADNPSRLWIEGENATRSSTHRNAWFDDIDPTELSGDAQIANLSDPNQPGGWAEYDVVVPVGGEYRFWLRANPGTGLLYAVDGSGWVKLDGDAIAKEDQARQRMKGYAPRSRQRTNIAADGTHDVRFMTWYDLGLLKLTEGKHAIRFNLGGEQVEMKRFAAIDCFVLARGVFTPNFQYKPGERPTALVGLNSEDSWPFSPKRDLFSPAALLDLSNLNESFAGKHGFIGVSPDGNSFVRGDGQPIRFWGGTTYTQREARERKDQAILLHHAHFLAKRGVNIVRLHCAIEPKQEGSNVTDVDEKELDEIYRTVAAMKKFGIYTVISPFWPSHAHPRKSWGVVDAGNGNCTGLLFFDRALQRGYKAWLRRIYGSVNPYTGVPIAKDPAVALIQLQNEDSLLFWTMQGISGQAYNELCRLYGAWALKKYGSREKVRDAWRGCAHDNDELDTGVAGIFIVWELTQDARNKKGDGNGRAARLADQAEFFGRLMFDFNQETERFLREDLGCRQLINAGNWRTADQVILDDVERWSYTANEVIGKNHYFSGLHNGMNVGWQILPGQTFTSKSFTTNPENSPLNIRQVVGRPFIISESLWVPPNQYEAEGPLVVAAQSSLTGLDLLFWFATHVPEWQPPGTKWTFSVPMTLGQFPAAALMFRNGYVQEGPAVVHEERRLQDIWERRVPLIAEGGAWDPNRDVGEMPTGTPFKTIVDPLAYLVGRVEVKYEGNPSNSMALELGPYIDTAKKHIRSVTGEIETDLARGIYRVDTPRAQAVAGMLGRAGMQKLSDVTVVSKNDYACVTVVSLDQKPIATSRRILTQIGTFARPTGWKEKPMRIPTKEGTLIGSRIIDAGGPPWRIEKMHGALGVKNTSINKATVLDPNGLPISDIPIWRGEGEIRISLPSSALYVCLSSLQE